MLGLDIGRLTVEFGQVQHGDSGRATWLRARRGELQHT